MQIGKAYRELILKGDVNNLLYRTTKAKLYALVQLDVDPKWKAIGSRIWSQKNVVFNSYAAPVVTQSK